ncbi:M56 family metallopeptidase [Rhodocytophaga aerolata]|uniref:M56 family metallopeptidase n=1 Tax=Rhodocytophaga aerolata TaxID=455078 RepID=A0ABT8RH52_9BACT|nr:M56 family metallopeptidase [Rhodocytophaga aerolata]MDO1451428.1 M56 family metallopeptidase [Rhodocytophaga aerolata]
MHDIHHPLFTYLLESSTCLAVLYLFFRLLLYKEPLLQTNRFFILTAVLLSLLIPALHIPLAEKVVFASPMFLLQEVTATGTAKTDPFPAEKYALYAYVCIGISLLLRTLWQIGKLLYFSRTSPARKTGAYQLILTDGKLPTFSFFRLLFWDNSQPLSEEQQEQILQHELTHIRQWHSLDILFLEVVKAFFWFHPAVYLFKKGLQQTHEYLADAAVVKEHNRDSYIQLMVAQVVETSTLTLINPFSQLKTTNRIMMLHKLSQAKPSLWKIALSLPLIAVLTLIYSCDTTSEELSPESNTSTSITNYEDVLNKYKQKYPDIWIGSIITEQIPGSSRTVKVVVENVHNASDKLNIEKEIAQAISNSIKSGLEQEPLAPPPPPIPADEKIYRVVEHQPEPTGGFGELMRYLGENIRYPEEARKKGIEGKVFLQFVVNTNGSISDVQVLKGIGNGCDEEAIRVLKAMPSWKPGLQKGEPVNVLMAIPINFKLD